MASSTRRHARFKKPLAEYAIEFGVSERTLKHWIRRGKEMGEKVPLDSPGKLAAWFQRCFGRRIPAYLTSIQEADSAGSADQPPAPPPEPRDFSDVKALDIEENVQALRVTLAINKKLLDEALTVGTEKSIALRQQNYERCFDLLRKAEQSLTELQRIRGNLIDKEAVLAELAQQSETFATTRERMARDIMIEVEKHCPKRLTRIFRLIKNLLEPAIKKVREGEDEIFRNLQAFGEPKAIEERLDLVLQRE